MKKEIAIKEGLMPIGESQDLYAQYYDSMIVNHTEDLSMYDQIASTEAPPYFEVGCGTGRVLLHLLSKKPKTAQGHYLTGVDISDAMLSICRNKTGKFINEGFLQVKNHDFSIGELRDQKFHAAFITFFTFNYVPENLQTDFLTNIGKSLYPGGLITLDCFYPHLLSHPEKANQWIDNEPLIVNSKRIGFRQKTQMATPTIENTEWMFIEPNGVINTVSRSKIYVSPQKCVNLLKTAGFTDIRRLLNYEMPSVNDFTENCKDFNFVLTARKS